MTYMTKAKQFFSDLAGSLATQPSLSTDTVEFNIEDAGRWLVDFGTKTVRVLGKHDEPTVSAILRARERDFTALVEGRMNAADGLLTERLHIAGNAATIHRLMSLFKKETAND
jgi:putative sterol carrier protein